MESAVDSPYDGIVAASAYSSVIGSGRPNPNHIASDCRSLGSTAAAAKGTMDGRVRDKTPHAFDEAVQPVIPNGGCAEGWHMVLLDSVS